MLLLLLLLLLLLSLLVLLCCCCACAVVVVIIVVATVVAAHCCCGGLYCCTCCCCCCCCCCCYCRCCCCAALATIIISVLVWRVRRTKNVSYFARFARLAPSRIGAMIIFILSSTIAPFHFARFVCAILPLSLRSTRPFVIVCCWEAAHSRPSLAVPYHRLLPHRSLVAPASGATMKAPGCQGLWPSVCKWDYCSLFWLVGGRLASP